MNANMGDIAAAKVGIAALYCGADHAVTGLTMRVVAFLWQPNLSAIRKLDNPARDPTFVPSFPRG